MTNRSSPAGHEQAELKEGDPIWYRQASRGGYGYVSDIPGKFVRASGRRVTVLLTKKDGTEVQVPVHPKNVRRRDPEAVWR